MAHDPPHVHSHRTGALGWIERSFHVGGHTHAPIAADAAFLDNQEGIRTVWMALAALGVTSALQVAVVAFSGSVALLADTAHNIGDTLNSIPLLAAFYLARRAAMRRYTYGYGRAEDVAGIFIVLSIAISAGIVLWETAQKLMRPQMMENIPWVAAAGIIGFLGNEAVAMLQVRTGRRIGSDAMVADGLHARIDGLTSLAVVIAAAGSALGYPVVDPIIGLLIGLTIVFVARDAAVRVWYRLMDAVDPALVSRLEHFAGEVEGVERVVRLRVRWVGHRLHAEATIAVDDDLTLAESHQIAANVRAAWHQAVPHLSEATIGVDPIFRHVPADVDRKWAASSLLPPRYQNAAAPSAAPMGTAALKYDADGNAAWNEVWTDFCDLALAGGPPHRGRLLEPTDPGAVRADPAGYERVTRELERGLRMVTGLPVVRGEAPGWVGIRCDSEAMALWLLRAIVVENVSVRREHDVLFFPAGPDFELAKEIKAVITVVAKTTHYWREHAGATD